MLNVGIMFYNIKNKIHYINKMITFAKELVNILFILKIKNYEDLKI